MSDSIKVIVGSETRFAAIAQQAKQASIDLRDEVQVLRNQLDPLITNLAALLNVEADIAKVAAVADDLDEINAVFDKLTEIDNVSGKLTEIEGVYLKLAEIQSVFDKLAEIETLAGLSAQITALGARTAEIDALFTNLAALLALHAALTELLAIHANLAALVNVATDLTQIKAVEAKLTEIEGVFNQLGDINDVAGALVAIGQVAAELTDIGTVAFNIAAVNTTATNIDAIIAALDNAEDSEKHAQETTTFTDSNGTSYDKGSKGWSEDAQTAATAALANIGVDENFISWDNTLPDSTGAGVGTKGAYFKDNELYQVVEWDGSEWQDIGQPITTKTYVDDKASVSLIDSSQVNFYNISSTKDNSQAYFKKNNNTDIDFLLPLSGSKFSRVKMIKNTIDDYVQIDSVDVVETIGARVGSFEFDSQTGTFNTSNSPNHYAAVVDSTLTLTFTGTGLEFLHLAEDRGGIWEFVLDGDESTTVSISTYNTLSSDRTSKIYSGLSNKQHTVVATFKGDDPENPPSSGEGTSRGWYKNDFESLSNIAASGTEKGPFVVLDGDSGKNVIETVANILVGFSNKEFAFSSKVEGSSNDAQWLPEHGGVGTTFGTVSVKIDDKDISDIDATGEFAPFKSCEYYQGMTGKNTLDNIDLCEIDSSMIINSEGLYLTQSFEWLVDSFVDAGYVNMIPINRNFGTLLLDSRNNSYDITLSDGSDNPLDFRDNLQSVAVASSIEGLEDYIIGVEFDDNIKTFLFNKTNYRVFDGDEKRFWWEARTSNNLSKLYPQIFHNQSIPAGFRHKAKMRLTVGKLKKAIKSLT